MTKSDKRHSRLLELGLGDQAELINHISSKFISDISERINNDPRFLWRSNNKKVFSKLLVEHSIEYVQNFISSFDKESLQKLLIEFNKLEK